MIHKFKQGLLELSVSIILMNVCLHHVKTTDSVQILLMVITANVQSRTQDYTVNLKLTSVKNINAKMAALALVS